MLNPYVEGNVYPFVVCFFGLSLRSDLARRAPLRGRRSCDAHPAAPDVTEKMQCESNNAMLSAATNAYCSSSDCLQKPRSIHSKINAKSMKNRAQGVQNPSKFDLAAPNRCQIVARSSQNRFLGDLGAYFGAQSGVEICAIPCKFTENCDHVYIYKFMVSFHGL